jgi:RND family efflux transporter MFP subunit
MENTQLLSPIDGIVTARNYDNGDLYAGAAILTVEQIRPVKLLVNVSENYYSKVNKGDQAAITLDALPGETFTATVSLKYPTINAATHTFPVELMLTNKEEKVRPGMFARAQINFGTENHVVVPDMAIVKQPGSGERFVYVYDNGKVNYVKVELGQRLDDAYELIGGISDGATVVIAGQGRLADGMEVRVEK